MIGTDNPIRRALGRTLYGAGYWLIHGHSAWDEPVKSHYSFTREDAPLQEVADEAARLERAMSRGDFATKLSFGDRHTATVNVHDWLSNLKRKHKDHPNG